MKERGVVLVISMIVLSILLVLTAVYFSGLLVEKKASDTEEFLLQAVGLAEAGAHHALAELRERVRVDLKGRVSDEDEGSEFQPYIGGADSLGFLRDYAYAAGETPFTIAGNQATLNVTSLDLSTGVQGNYAATVVIQPNGVPTSPKENMFVFPYKFTLESVGTVTGADPDVSRRVRLLNGSFSLTVRKDSLAKFALFTSHHSTPSGSTVWFTANTNFNGPVSTNGRFSFANNPSAHFTDEAAQHENRARYYNNGWPVLLDNDHNGALDAPVFEQGFNRGEAIINLASAISQTELKEQALGGIAEPGEGVVVVNNGTSVVGGIYVRGNQGQHSDDPTIVLGKDASDNPAYTITRSGTTTVVTVDYAQNQTTVQEGAASHTYNGIPDGAGDEGILIYVNDDIASLSGTVARTSEVTVSSERDVIITNHILYQDYAASPLSADGTTNLLGIISWGGDVRIGSAAPNDVNIHGVITAPHGVFTVDDYNQGSPRGTATLLGGVITDFYGPFGTFSGSDPSSGYGRNFVYDERMAEGSAPPYFPYFTNFASFDDGNLDSKLIWQDAGG